MSAVTGTAVPTPQPPEEKTTTSTTTASDSSATPAVKCKTCSVCQISRPESEYSGAQLKKQGKRICCLCVSSQVLKGTPKKDTLTGVSDGGCFLIRTNPNNTAKTDPTIHIYQDVACDQFMIFSQPGMPAPTLNQQGELTFDHLTTRTTPKPPSYIRCAVGAEDACARPHCDHWKPQVPTKPEWKSPKQPIDPKSLIPCQKCERVFYCSEACRTQHHQQHDKWCLEKKTNQTKAGSKGKSKLLK